VKKGSFLPPMERIVGRIEVQHNLAHLTSNCFDSTLDQKRFDLFGAGRNFVIPKVGPFRAQFQAIQRRTSRQGFTFVPLKDSILTQRIAFTGY